jgi:hypothetical protein
MRVLFLHSYVDEFGLTGPCDDINIVLPTLARRIGALFRGGEPDLLHAAQYMITKYRCGKLGSFILD